MPEVIDAPLDAGRLSQRWREILQDPLLASVPGKVALDLWGRIIVSPVSTERAGVAGRLARLLEEQLGGRALVEAGVRTGDGVFAPDALWCSGLFWRARRNEAPLEAAPALCIEIASPSNSLQDLRAKVQAYLRAGAQEAWLVFPVSRRVEHHAAGGPLDRSAFQVELSTLFD